ncbi:hypothetical protein T07_12123 [Trichinella nelsoni]|uniref:Uncharacterized protein n=1 Tax=Trichinella nelsoni TaxID=6336 RepID=A0A0V0RL74_9BILA|nr:hypothetical protein T07_12123 [Trichinella nelsoni]
MAIPLPLRQSSGFVNCSANRLVCQRDLEFPTTILRIQWKICFVQLKPQKHQSSQRKDSSIKRVRLHVCFLVSVLSKRYDYAKKTEGSCRNCAVDLSRSFTSDSDVVRNG